MVLRSGDGILSGVYISWLQQGLEMVLEFKR